MAKLRVAVHKFTSCDGCQLQFLNLEAELLALADRVDIVHFREASSEIGPGPYDVSFLEGSVSTEENLERVREIRAVSQVVIAIGACATAGGIQALRNWHRHADFLEAAYAHPEHIDSLAHSTAFGEHIQVDYALPGCPPDQGELKRVLADLLAGVRPRVPDESVCIQCKRAGHVCVLVARGEPCLGPVTRIGCGALCPAHERDCYGCFGPQAGANPDALGRRFLGLGLAGEAIARRYRFIYNWDPTFRAAAERWEKAAGEHAPLPGRAERP